MNSWKQWSAALLVVTSFTILIMWFYIRTACSGDGHESGSDKHEWSLTQVIEARNGNRAVSDLEFIDDEDYHIVGIPNVQGKTTWVMLNPQSPPYYKQFGANYSLTKEQLQRITGARHVISTVEQALESHVQGE
jgi:hypothetical protein